MCGIGAVLAAKTCDTTGLSAALLKALMSRGPDMQSKNSTSTFQRETSDPVKVDFVATVLHLRGAVAQPQPLVDDKGNILLWNGEVFAGRVQPHITSFVVIKLWGNKLV